MQAVAVTLWWGAAAAQPALTASNVERLHDRLFEAGTAIARLRTGDALLRKELQGEANDIRTAATALEARLGAGESVGRDAYAALRRRVAAVKRRARSHVTVTGSGGGPTARAPYPSAEPPALEIPAGVELQARMLSAVDPETARRGDLVEAATVAAYAEGGRDVLPAGSLLRGVVHVRPAENGRAGEAPRLTVTFEDVLVAFTTHPVDAAVTEPVTDPLRVGSLVLLRFE